MSISEKKLRKCNGIKFAEIIFLLLSSFQCTIMRSVHWIRPNPIAFFHSEAILLSDFCVAQLGSIIIHTSVSPSNENLFLVRRGKNRGSINLGVWASNDTQHFISALCHFPMWTYFTRARDIDYSVTNPAYQHSKHFFSLEPLNFVRSRKRKAWPNFISSPSH